MDWITISLFCVLEVALLLSIFAVFLKRKNNRLRCRIEELERRDEPSAAFESIESGYLPYLEKQIIDSRARQELCELETGTDEALLSALSKRLEWLESEKKLIELCNDYPQRRWEHVTECFRPPQVEAEEQIQEVEATAEDPMESPDSQETESGEHSVEQLAGILGRQGDALQSFRQVFEVVRKQPDPQALEQMEKQLRELEHQYREASTCIEIMEQENQRLQYKVEQGNWRLDRSEAENHETIVDLQGQLGKQKRNISELNLLIDDLQLEAEKAAALQAKLDQFDLASRDMNMCIQIMEEENEFLRDQVQALLKLDGDAAADKEGSRSSDELEQQIGSLQAGLQEKDERIKALEKEYASMEEQYLALYEQTQS